MTTIVVKSSETACKNLSGGKICQVASTLVWVPLSPLFARPLPTRPDPPLLLVGFVRRCGTFMLHLKNIDDFALTVHNRWGNRDSPFSRTLAQQ
jgi:hypothetical protein